MLADASNTFLSSKGPLLSLNRKLIALGRTRGSAMLAETGVAPVFGLTSIQRMMKFLKTPKYQLRLLRTYAARYFSKADPFDIILRYRVPVAFGPGPPPEGSEEADFNTEKDQETILEGTTFSPSRKSRGYNRRQVRPDQILGPFPAGVGSRRSPSTKREYRSSSRGPIQSGLEEFHSSCGRILQTTDDGRLAVPQEVGPDGQGIITEGSALVDDDDGIALAESIAAPRIETHLVDDDEDLSNVAVPVKRLGNIEYATALPYILSESSSASVIYRWTNPKQKVESLGEEEFAERLICKAMPKYSSNLDHANYRWSVPDDAFHQSAMGGDFYSEATSVKSYKYFVGDPESAAMFVDQGELERCKSESGLSNWGRTRPPIKESCDLKDLQAALDADIVDMTEMLAAIIEVTKDSDYFNSLKALAEAYKIYNEFDGATVSPSAVTKPIIDANWARNMKTQSKTDTCLSSISLLNRLQTFACIAYFESGCLDMNPSQFDNVMALSSGDSIYVASWLICDPAECQPAESVRRLHGNVGKAGLILLVPPADPKTLAPEVDNWKFIDREEFDGTVTNTFTGTSLHLSFTDWCIPVDVGGAGRGRRDAEAYIIESLVSVYDRGKWIADLDVLQALNKGCSQPDHEFFYKPFCNHNAAEALDPKQSIPPIVTMKNWDEFLEHPKSPSVAMAHGNWDAKLALAVLGVRRGDRVFVMDRICENCYLDVKIIGGDECVAKALFLL